MKCCECHREFDNKISLIQHIRFHKLSSKEYYDKYLKKEGEGICSMYGQIPSCNKYTKFKNLIYGYNIYCSCKCSANSKIIRSKTKQTNIKKYGSENVFQSKEIKDKIKKTNLEIYGVENPFQSEKIKEKIKKTNLKLYGAENPFQSKEIKEKIKQTNIKKYGVENPLQNNEIREKIKQTCLKKYGCDHPNKSYIIKNKIYNSRMINVVNNLSKSFKYLNLKLLDNRYFNCYYKHNWKCLKCGYKFKQIWNRIQQGYTCSKCYPRNKSVYEYEIINFLNNNFISFVLNDRDILDGKELDIYLNDLNIGIEIDGLYWHNEKFKDKNYHLNKTELCEKQNIKLIHIFEDEWVFKQEIVKSRLRQIFGINNSKRIHARKCEIKEISPKVKNEFLDKYHIQGKDRSVIKLGAFYNDELVSVMTFSHGNISKGSKNINGIWELNRFCSNSNYHIPGIASKLLTHFKRNYEWFEIFSYADRRWSDGGVYNKLGFKLDSITKPNYWYVKNFNRIHRFNLRKRPDEPKDIPEWVLRQKEGYHRIWDCGHYKFNQIKFQNKKEK